jgi:hypothetical protein
MLALDSVKERTVALSAAVRKSPTLRKFAGWLLIAVAVLLRTRQYLFNRSLWGDEVMLALNIINRNFAGLLKPLKYGQGAPLGFLYTEKLFVTLFGNHDYILRLFPFLAGIAAVFVMAWLAKRIFPGWAGVVALGLFTFSWLSIYYASEVKQYGNDLLFTLILLAAARSCSGTRVPRRNWLWLLGIGTLALWMSHPALFTIAAIVTVLGSANLLDKKWQNLSWLFGISLFWMINFLCTFRLSLRHIAANENLQGYFHKTFMPLPPWKNWDWFLGCGRMIFKNLLHLPLILGLAVLLIGVSCMFRRKWTMAALWALPILGAFLASGLSKYPIWPRFLLFSLPMLFFFLAAGMQALYRLATRFLPKSGFLFSAIIVFMLFWQPVAFSAHKFRSPENKKDIKSLMAHLRANRQPQDVIYVHFASQKQFRYYAAFYGIGRGKTIMGSAAKESAEPLFADIAKLAGRPRVWFLFANRFKTDRFDHEMAMLERLDRSGIQQGKYRATGAKLYLYDLSRH